MCIKPLQVAHYACIQYIKSLVLHAQKTFITKTIHLNNVIISPLTQHQ